MHFFKAIISFIMGFFFKKSIDNAIDLHKIKKVGKAYEKIDKVVDNRSDIDVLRKHT